MPDVESAKFLPPITASAAASIAVQMQEAIINANYSHGQRLPAERELANHFGTSRSTIREALKQLEDENLVVRRPGSGTFVNFKNVVGQSEIADITSPLELMEVREAIEPHLARLAIAHASNRSLSNLAEALERVESANQDAVAFSEADEVFHLTLADATDNPLMSWLYRQINEVRSHHQWAAARMKVLTPENIADYNRQHRAIFEAIRARDVDLSIKLLHQHISKARQDLLGIDGGR